MEQTEEFVTFNLVDQVAIEGVPEPGIVQIHSVAKDMAGRLYLSDEFNHRIVVLDSEGKYVRTVGERGSGPGEFWYPRGLAIVEFEGGEQLVACDAWNHRIQRFDLDGAFIDAFGSIGEGEDQFNEPVAVTPGDEGRIWILDRRNHRIKLCSLSGETLSIIGRHMTLDDEDRLNDPVDALLKPGGASSRAFGFNYPQAFARGADGGFVIADTNNNRLSVITEKGEAIRFVNLKGDKPPYCFPDSVTILSSGFALISGINMTFQVMDINRAWLSNTAQIGADDPLIKPAALFSGEGGDDTITLFDGREKLISEYSITCPVIDNHAPPIQQLSIDSKNISGNWVNMIGGAWFDYLAKAPEAEQTTGQIKSFYATCRDEAKKATNKLNEHERAYLKHLVEYYESKALLDKTKAEGRPQKELEPDILGKLLTLRQDEKRRTELRRILIQNLGWIIKLFGNLNDEYRENNLSAEESDLRDLLQAEFDLRRNDYDKIESWIREALEKVDSLNVPAALHACAGLGILYDHLNYLERSLAALSGVIEEGKFSAPSLPEAIASSHENMVHMSSNILLVLGSLSEGWGMSDSAITIYRHGINAYPLQSGAYLNRLINVYRQRGDFSSGLSVIDEFASRFSETPQLHRARGNALKLMFRYKEATEAYQKAMDIEPDAELLFSVADLNEKSGKFQEALDGYHTIIEATPAQNILYEKAVISYARMLCFQGKYEEALKFLDSHTLSGLSVQRDLQKVTILRQQERFTDSASLLEKLARENPKALNINWQLAISLSFAGDFAAAEAAIPKAISQAGSAGGGNQNVHELTALVRIICKRLAGKYKEATQPLSTGLHERIQRPQVVLELAIAALGAGDQDLTEKAMIQLLSHSETPYWHGYVFYMPQQSELVEGAMNFLSDRFEKEGKQLIFEQRRSTHLWYSVSHAQV
ncbi:hypothetical protein MNBD_NITROSPINAE03-1357 [hydrothermal vent metagenome]|uniref:Uncharacterized protein n=1 Tax=hydrothermal vent metagenome TaxID=652676 RepID=A0A3B1C0Z7_9ZZZZ